MTDDTSPPLSTRERALEAGLAVWLETDPATLFGGLNVSRVSERAGITRATFYTYWGTAQEYLDELVTYSHKGLLTLDNDYAGRLVRLTFARDDVALEIMTSAIRTIEALVADPSLRIRLGMLSKADDPVVAAKLRDQYAETEAEVGQYFSQMLDRWGRVVRPPLDMAALVVLMSSHVEGYSARAIVDPELAPPQHYAYAAMAHMLTLTTPRDHPRDMSELAAVLDGWPDHADRIRALEHSRGRHEVRVPLPFEPDEIVNQVRVTVAVRPWHELSLEHLAREADISVVQLTSSFGSKHGLGVALLELLVREAFEVLPPVDDPLARLRLQLRTFAELLRRLPALAHSAMLVYTGMAQAPNTGLIAWDVAPTLASSVDDCITTGQLSDELVALEAAMMLTCTLVCRSAALNIATSVGPGDPVEYVLRGMGADPDPRGIDPSTAR